ncbi:MAG: hypothetical protein H7Y00_09280 [Fimbriimonadaceae bacterium]|nr:hypothetical protein [Chitinophagales bacterium]
MKPIKILFIILSIGSMIMGCQKNSLNPVTDVTDLVSDLSTARRPISEFIVPENFVEDVTNPYFPLEIGDTLFYKTTVVEDGETIIEDSYIAITDEVKIIAGISCVVLHDVVTIDGVLFEDTYDWHVQDIYGNVWYFGEDTKKYAPDGSFSTEGSFEHGVDGAVGGMFMLADPGAHIGRGYKQEDYPGHAQDRAKVISTTETVTIGLGTFTNCVKTEETSPLAPGELAVKYYAPGIGQIYSETVIGGEESQELVGMSD